MDISKERPTPALTTPLPRSKKSRIVVLLSILGVRRRQELAKADYIVLATDLERFELVDIEAGLEALGWTDRREGETGFPTLAIMAAFIKASSVSRLNAKIQPCELCDSMRMVVVVDVKTGQRYAKDCECLRAWKAKRDHGSSGRLEESEDAE